ncbi:MAG TPA: hypothetical protein VGI80_08095 [Pyrinomonadaceae bacterium]
MSDMRALDTVMRQQSEKDRAAIQKLVSPPELDKKTKDRIRQMRTLNAADVEQYRTFLAQPGTGIFKIFPSYECSSENVIRVDTDCAKWVPESSDFSFRQGVYTTRLYHDIGLEKVAIIADAFFTQGLMTTLGDVPIETTTLDTAGIAFLSRFRAASTPAAAKQSAAEIERGISTDGFRYGMTVEPTVNTTYAIRSISYSLGNSLPPLTIESGLNEMKLHSLDLDKRQDVIVVFRVIRMEENGGLTLVWKQLAAKDAPKLTFRKGELIKDFK